MKTEVETTTQQDERYQVARALQGLAEANRGEGIPVQEARQEMQTFIAEHRS